MLPNMPVDTSGTSASESADDFRVKVGTGDQSGPRHVAIVGNGTFGRALGDCIESTGAASVLYGSRRSAENGSALSLEEAASQADIIILATPAAAHRDVVTALAPALREKGSKEKVIVDVSNKAPGGLLKRGPPDSTSYAEQLLLIMKEENLPQPIVKCFNTISAYALQDDGIRSPQTVHLCSNDSTAKQQVSDLVRCMGLIPLDLGTITSANYQESLPHRFFKGWKIPLLVSTVVSIFWLLYLAIRWFIIKVPSHEPGKPPSSILDAESAPLSLLIGGSGEAAMSLFSIVFFASTIAAIVQLYRKTASRPFHWALGAWLAARKPLGLIAFFLIILHAVGGAISPSHLDDGYLGRLYFLFGIVSFGLFLVLAATSNTSISSNLSWVEFRFVFSWIGFTALGFGLAHMVTFGGMIQNLHPSSPGDWPGGMMQSYFLGCILPSLAILGKLVLSTPCIGRPLGRIRGTLSK